LLLVLDKLFRLLVFGTWTRTRNRISFLQTDVMANIGCWFTWVYQSYQILVVSSQSLLCI